MVVKFSHDTANSGGQAVSVNSMSLGSEEGKGQRKVRSTKKKRQSIENLQEDGDHCRVHRSLSRKEQASCHIYKSDLLLTVRE